MAADGVFFPRLAALHPEYRTPTAAILVMAAWSIVLTLSGTFSQLVDYVAFGDWIFFGLTVAGLFIYRAREAGGPGGAGGAGRAVRLPGDPPAPGAFVAAALCVGASPILAHPRQTPIAARLLSLTRPACLP